MSTEVRRVSDSITCLRRASYLTCSYIVRLAQRLIHDADVLLDHFEVVSTPGHTAGHVSYFYRPERALFAGDALAVIEGRIRFMARPVTLDTDAARRSLARCLALRPQIVCPGHREPLVSGAAAACESMATYLAQGGKWPLLV